jgi:hypothetical protein
MSEITYSNLKETKKKRSSFLNEHLKFSKEKKNKNSSTYGHRYFCGKYGSKYATHNKLQRHHNKMRKPFRLVDVRSVRYATSYLLQRLLDVFMICWFICGNYWIYNVVEADNKKKLKSNISNVNKSMVTTFSPKKNKTSEFKTNFTQIKYLDNERNSTKKETHAIVDDKTLFLNITIIDQLITPLTNLTNFTSVSIELNKICYQTALFQIIATYSLFALIVIFIFSYRLYSIVSYKKPKVYHNKHPCKKEQFHDKNKHVPVKNSSNSRNVKLFDIK